MPADLQWYEILARLAIAAVLGAAVGLEREFAGQDAGFRTHLMLALGAATFGVVSVGAFDEFIGEGGTNVQVDVTRIASYVAAGVGFIGGGAILKHAGTVRGITTATSLWVAAAIGLSSGVGMWQAAVAATGISIVALAALKPLSDWIDRRSHLPKTIVVLVRKSGISSATLGVVEEFAGNAIKAVNIGEGHDGDTTEVVVQFWSEPGPDVLRKVSERLDEKFGSDIAGVSLRN